MNPWIVDQRGDLVNLEKFASIVLCERKGRHLIVGIAPGVAVDANGGTHYDETEIFTGSQTECAIAMEKIRDRLEPLSLK